MIASIASFINANITLKKVQVYIAHVWDKEFFPCLCFCYLDSYTEGGEHGGKVMSKYDRKRILYLHLRKNSKIILRLDILI